MGENILRKFMHNFNRPDWKLIPTHIFTNNNVNNCIILSKNEFLNAMVSGSGKFHLNALQQTK